MDNYQVHELIGRGATSSVYRCTYMAPKTISDSTTNNEAKSFALKKCHVSSITHLNVILHEASCCMQLRQHDHIVNIRSFFVHKQHRHHHPQQQQQSLRSPNITMTVKSYHNAEQHAADYEHDYIMSLPSCDVFSSEELWFVCLVFDYCNQGTLRTILKRHDLKKKKQQHRDHTHISTGILNLQRIMTWMHQILSALQYMHQNHVIHRDVKPDNCFLNRGKIQLGDMGFARRLMSDSAFASSVLGTQGYIAPELRNENPKYDFKVDIFGAGCTLLELLLWKRIDFAYQILNNPAAIFQSVRENFEAEDQKLLLLAETMARSMLVANPDDRPDASSLLQAFYEVSARSQISFHVSNDSMDQDEIKQNRRSVFSDYQMKRLKLRQMMMVMDSDIYCHIFFYLSISNILKNRAVCRLWDSIISEPRTCRQLCEKMSMDDYEIESVVRGNKSGINAFVQSYRVRTNWSVGRYSYAQFNIQGAPNICCVYGKTGDQMVRHLKNIYEQTRIHNRRTENTTRSVTNDSFVESSDHAVLLTGSRSGSLHLHDVYNLNTGKDIELRTIRTFNGHSDAVLCSVFDPEKLSRIVVSISVSCFGICCREDSCT